VRRHGGYPDHDRGLSCICGRFRKTAPTEARSATGSRRRSIRSSHFDAFHGKEQNGGFVQAWDARKNQLLWDRMIYRIRYDRNREREVQDVFITGIHLDGKTLFVTNESSERFEMDLASGKVRALTPLGPGRELPVDSAKR
jgi:hypothetical protein